MDCPACGKPIQDEDAFCKHCGRRLGGVPRQSRSATVDDMEREYRHRLADEAAEAFGIVIELLPEDASGYEKLAITLAKLNRRDEALERARQACRLDPESGAIKRLVKALGG
jgi:tetratricopeptide (TPR) repeat protein